jgi:hypothetical protein
MFACTTTAPISFHLENNAWNPNQNLFLTNAIWTTGHARPQPTPLSRIYSKLLDNLDYFELNCTPPNVRRVLFGVEKPDSRVLSQRLAGMHD